MSERIFMNEKGKNSEMSGEVEERVKKKEVKGEGNSEQMEQVTAFLVKILFYLTSISQLFTRPEPECASIHFPMFFSLHFLAKKP